MATANAAEPVPLHPMLAAIARAPKVSLLTPEQRAELDEQVAAIEAGRARLVPHEDLPAALEAMYREEHGDAG
jgi:hypothetical protein